MTEEGDPSPETPVPVAKSVGPPKWESTTRDQISAGLRRVVKAITALETRDAVEADTRLLVTDVLCDLLGFDKYEELTAEYSVKGEFADFGIRIDKQMTAFVEIKRVTQKLNATHLRQVENYCLKHGVSWAVLTNARHWQLYNIQSSSGEKAETNLVLEVDLLSEAIKPKDMIDTLLIFSRVGFTKGLVDEAWRQRFVSSPKALKPVVFSRPVIEEIRKELWRQQRVKVDAEIIRNSLGMMIGDE